MTGMIQGGWEFVHAAYGLTALVLSGYALSILLRYRRAVRGEGNRR